MLFSFTVIGQNHSHLDIAFRHLENNKEQLKFTSEDISDIIVSDKYVSTPSQATMIYLVQRHQGVEVDNAIFNFAITNTGEVAHTGNRFVEDLASKVNTVSPSINPADAIQAALGHLDVPMNSSLVEKERINSQKFVFDKGAYSKSDMTVNLKLYPNGDEVRLVWEVSIEMLTANDFWKLKIDATNGKMLDKYNLIVKCQFHDKPYHNHDVSCRSLDNVKIVNSKKKKTEATSNVVLGGIYNVYGEVDGMGNVHPHESPSHGSRNSLSGIEYLTASPFGWHDTNGQAGPEFTITRGNNAHSYLDLNGSGISQNDEPDGDVELIFDYPIDVNNEPESFEDAAVTNAFFMVNFMHDYAYAYGFDEAGGNFQANNYGNGGSGNDYVNVQVHDGSGTNNATFGTPTDGGNGTMQMFLWNSGTEGLLTVADPIDVAGIYDVSHPGDWGGQIDMNPLTAEAAIVNDGSITPTMACETLINPAEVAGKIAIIDRGICQFSTKAFNAQEAGAVGAIICNFEDVLQGLGPGDLAGSVTIPVISMTSSDCATIRGFAGNGLVLTFVEPANSGPGFVSGAIDNGVIAHEYGHGISIRTIGGGNNVGCLNNGEQMGEGISDFFSLVTTVKPGDTGDMSKGIGTYTQRQDNDGRGIRRHPYSTDMSLNPVTYKDIVGEAQHARGTIWASVLWDMFWGLVDEHGFDADYLEGTGGNNIAVHLAMEGMRLSPCGPGYIDGRDAILAADVILYNGANQCIIWEAFARRGMGLEADQVSSNNTSDGFEDFSLPGECTKDMRITKTVTDIVAAGDVIDVTIQVTNYKDNTVSDVVVTDEIPAGASYVAGSATNGGTASGNTVVFNLGDVASQDVMELTYQLNTDPNISSIRTFYDDMEDGDANWDIEILNGTNIWNIRDDSLSNSGDAAWYIQDVAIESQQTFLNLEPFTISGTQPVLRFYHWYETEHAADGGLVEISTDAGDNWLQLGDKMFREGYPRELQYATFVIPFLSAFSGESNLTGPEFTATYVDLADYIGEDVHIRFRFGSDDNTSGVGWFVDDIEVMDMRNYEGQACLTSGDGDDVCAIGIPRGTIVESGGTVSTTDPFDTNMEVSLFPNPTDDIVNLHVLNDKQSDATVRILSLDGKELMTRSFRTSNGVETMSLNVSSIPAGMYFVKVSTDEGIVVEKLTIK